MVKEGVVMLRVHKEDKDRIEAAARAAGKSVTNLILEATMQAVEKIEKAEKPKATPRGHLPAHFRGSCITASTGGSQSYRDVGYGLIRGLAQDCPDDLEEDEWFERLRELEHIFLNFGPDEDVYAWFDENLPRFIGNVPARRRQSFIDGMRECCKEEGLPI